MPDEEWQEEAEVSARPFWSGTLTFGLVSIPVALHPAQRSVRVSLRMLSPEGVPLRREYYAPRTNRRVDADEIVRGYEVGKDEYVIVTDEELEALAPDRSRDIDLRLFVDRREIDPVFFDHAWFLTPAGESTKAYRLLAETMERTGRAGIATFVMRAREYLVAILADEGILRAETLRFADELRSPGDVGLPEPVEVKDTQVQHFQAVLRKLARPGFDPDQLHDRGAERLLELIERKQQAGEDVRVVEARETAPPRDVIDLMEVLKRSLAGGAAAGAGEQAGAGDGRKTAAQGRKGAQRAEPAGRRGDGRRSQGDGLESLTKEELYERARRLEIAGRSRMSRAQLITAVRRAS